MPGVYLLNDNVTRLDSWETVPEIQVSIQDVYQGVFLGSTAGDRRSSWGVMQPQKRPPVTPSGSSEAEVTHQDCYDLEREDQTFVTSRLVPH